MRKFSKISTIFLIFIFVIIFSFSAAANDFLYQTKKRNDVNLKEIELYPGGMPFGVQVMTKGLTIIKFASENAPAVKAGLKVGDIIVRVNNKEINSIEDFSKIINSLGKNEINVTVLRNGKKHTFIIIPEYNRDEGSYKTGIWVKDSTAGIGTVTFINPENNAFGGLGHGICNSSNGEIVPLSKGTVLDVNINGVKKGRIGCAGELKGTFNPKKIGTLTTNSSLGVFGYLSTNSYNSPEGKMKICPKEEVIEGDAYIWCTLDNSEPQRYSISIYDINPSSTGSKSFRVKITDKRLLEKSGGIVQGMSGSPIIQNGRIVGAVTHVLVNDPTQGYGIFIENMLSAAPDLLC